jgi:polyisoprenyl-phosphate glycosyltransferase
MDISIVSPVHKGEFLVNELVERIYSTLKDEVLEFEIILVDDRSEDNTWIEINRLKQKYSFVRGLRLSKNFGQHKAITAGLNRATGYFTIILDCDLQDDPLYILDLLNEARKGYDIVFTKRKNRRHSYIKTIGSWFYLQLFKIFSNREFEIDMGSLVLLNEKVRLEFLKLNDIDRLYVQLLKWLGFNSTFIEVEHNDRFSGESSYNFKSLIVLAIQGWTSHSNRLLNISIFVGSCLALLALMAIPVIFLLRLLIEFQTGWASLLVSIFFSTGLILIGIGVQGLYIGKIFQQVKNNPLYVIDEEI